MLSLSSAGNDTRPCECPLFFCLRRGIALDGKPAAAISRLEKTLAAHPNDRDILKAPASFHQACGESGKASKYPDRLRMLDEKAASGK
jgi:hypothetical protein